MLKNDEQHPLCNDESVQLENNGLQALAEVGSPLSDADPLLSRLDCSLPAAGVSQVVDSERQSLGDENVCSFEMGAAEKPRPFDKRDWAVLAFALLQAILWATVFWPPELHIGTPGSAALVPGLLNAGLFGFALPGVGLSIVQLSGFVCALVAIGKRGRYDRMTIPLLVACAFMCLFGALFANGVLRALNCLVLWAVGTYTLFLVADLWPTCRVGLASHLRALGLFFTSLVNHILRPFAEVKGVIRSCKLALEERGASENARGKMREIGLGAAVATALLIVVIPLLTSADMVFESLFDEAFNALFRMPDLGEMPLRVLYALVLAPFLFSLMWGFSRDAVTETALGAKGGIRRFRTATVVVILGALDAVYALFVAVQFVYLFGGAESVAMNGGYAEYARSGFFQLAAVAAINVCVGLSTMRFSESGRGAQEFDSPLEDGRPARAVVVLVWILILATFVILASAALRMGLYVDTYGLSILRCLTFLGMVFAAVLLIALAVKSLCPRFCFYRVAICAGTALWIAFNLINIDARIADYNVDAYLDGSIEQLDLGYFWSLSPDADPALKRLSQALDAGEGLGSNKTYGAFYDNSLKKGVEARLKASAVARECLPWQMQCLPYLNNMD